MNRNSVEVSAQLVLRSSCLATLWKQRNIVFKQFDLSDSSLLERWSFELEASLWRHIIQAFCKSVASVLFRGRHVHVSNVGISYGFSMECPTFTFICGCSCVSGLDGIIFEALPVHLLAIVAHPTVPPKVNGAQFPMYPSCTLSTLVRHIQLLEKIAIRDIVALFIAWTYRTHQYIPSVKKADEMYSNWALQQTSQAWTYAWICPDVWKWCRACVPTFQVSQVGSRLKPNSMPNKIKAHARISRWVSQGATFVAVQRVPSFSFVSRVSRAL